MDAGERDPVEASAAGMPSTSPSAPPSSENHDALPEGADAGLAPVPPEQAGTDIESSSPEGLPSPSTSTAHISFSVDIPPGSRLRLTIESQPSTGEPDNAPVQVIVEELEARPGEQAIIQIPAQGGGQTKITAWPGDHIRQGPLTRLQAPLRSWPYSLEITLFGCALALYLLTRLVGLTAFPIYFFTDEAVQTVAAVDLIRNDFQDEDGVLLPTYFKNGPFYNLSASVYLQLIPYLLFGKSVFVTRATSVLLTLLAAGAVSLILRDIFKVPYWWAATLLLSIAPAWFLHSRTAFETVLFVSFYAAFLYAYLLYRYHSPRYLNAAILLGALAFYTYSPGQLIIGLTGLLLLLSDFRYHWQNRSTVLRGLGLLFLLALPYLRFRYLHPEAPVDHLRKLGSYWVQPLSLNEKISRYLNEYLYGLSPGYWFIPNERDLPRHLMKGYGNLLRASLPFAALGLILALKSVRSSAHRLVLIALLVAPAGSALVQIGITRALVFIIPATILTALGVSRVLVWLEGRRLARAWLSAGLFAVLALVNLVMLRDALVNGPTWYQDYGLGGLQYGARQLFPEIRTYLARSPNTRIMLSPAWANGTDVVARFFLNDPLPIQLGSIDGHLFRRQPLDPSTLFIMIPLEYEQAVASGKFADIQVEKTLAYPDGRPGFYFVRLRYVDDIDQILTQERESRRALQLTQISLAGQPVQLRYPLLDMGEPGQIFDGDHETLGRTLEANPAIFELTFTQARSLHGIDLIIGSTQVELRVKLFAQEGAEPVEFSRILTGSVDQPQVSLDFERAVSARILALEIKDLHQGEPGHVHIWEISLH